MDEMKYQHMNYYFGEDDEINLEIHFEYYSNDNYVSDWLNFEPDEIIDIIDRKTDIREYKIKYILEAPQKQFLIDFIIEDLNEKTNQIITIDFEDIIIRRKEEEDTQKALESYNDQIFSSPDIE